MKNIIKFFIVLNLFFNLSIYGSSTQNQNTLHFANGSNRKVTIFFGTNPKGKIINAGGSLGYNPSSLQTSYTISAAECPNFNGTADEGQTYIICINNNEISVSNGTHQTVTGSLCPTNQLNNAATAYNNPTTYAVSASSQAQTSSKKKH